MYAGIPRRSSGGSQKQEASYFLRNSVNFSTISFSTLSIVIRPKTRTSFDKMSFDITDDVHAQVMQENEICDNVL